MGIFGGSYFDRNVGYNVHIILTKINVNLPHLLCLVVLAAKNGEYREESTMQGVLYAVQWPEGGGGGYSSRFWMGVCRPGL